MVRDRNLIMPGNPRYQPKELKAIFGYDNLYRTVGEVEIATLQTLAEAGKIHPHDVGMLTSSLVETMLDEIRTTEVDEIERSVTQHDIRAWVRRACQLLDQHQLGHLGHYLHIPLTSFDALHTGRILQYVRAWQQVIKPSAKAVLQNLADLTLRTAGTLQVGRTHGQHALPITVGFWFATILNRMLDNTVEIEDKAGRLVGKISGAVGAYNAQAGLNFGDWFEHRVLEKLGLKPAQISTQILPPEPLAYFLHAACLLSASIGQFGRDCRHLMRSEIGEVAESFEGDQVGSSTMAHKRNPLSFENMEGMWLKTKNEYGKVLDCLISEHQRDLVGSSVERDFPIILINVQHQLNSLLRKDPKTQTRFLQRITVDEEACRRNFKQNAHLLLSEPLYVALVLAGYKSDAHELVNRTLTPRAKQSGRLLIEECEILAEQDEAVASALQHIPADVRDLLYHPERYVGRAQGKAIDIAQRTQQVVAAL